MILTFTNKTGTLTLYGSGNHLFNICAIEGLEPPSKSRHVQSYVSEDGCIENSSQYNQRIITVSGDVQCANGSTILLKNAAKILSDSGTLIVDSNNTKRQITVNASTLTIGNRYGSYCTFVIQMTCDYPHFSDITQTKTPVFNRVNFLTSDSSLPLLLTERISEGNVFNCGDIKLYPLIEIRKISEQAGSNTITITNNTTGNSIVFNKNISKSEVIYIDIKNRTVTSSIGGDIIGTLNRYYSLADMWCDKGDNNISVSIDGSERGLEVYFIYANEYTEAL